MISFSRVKMSTDIASHILWFIGIVAVHFQSAYEIPFRCASHCSYDYNYSLLARGNIGCEVGKMQSFMIIVVCVVSVFASD